MTSWCLVPMFTTMGKHDFSTWGSILVLRFFIHSSLNSFIHSFAYPQSTLEGLRYPGLSCSPGAEPSRVCVRSQVGNHHGSLCHSCGSRTAPWSPHRTCLTCAAAGEQLPITAISREVSKSLAATDRSAFLTVDFRRIPAHSS